MRICYLHDGISIHDHKFLKYLVSRKSYDVHLLSFHNAALPRLDGLTVHQIPVPNSRLRFLVACLLTPWLIRRIKPDIVHGNFLLTYGFFSALAHYHPLLQMVWGSDALLAPQKNWLYNLIVKYSLQQADLVRVNCQWLRKVIVDLGYPAGKIVVFPRGVDFEQFNPDVEGDYIRRQLGWGDNTVIICTRNHEAVYGIEYLLAAIPEIVRAKKKARFLFIGSGSRTNRLKKLVAKLGVRRYVSFIGYVPNDMVGGYLTASDIYVSPSLSDGTSNCLLEAMACGLPVVVTDVEAILEWIADGVNGFVVPRREPAALARKIISLIASEGVRQTFGKKNYSIARERASWDDNVNVMDKVYEMLASRH